MFLEEWDEEKYRDLLRREAHEDGIEEGIEQGIGIGIEQGIERANDSFLARAAEQVRIGTLSPEVAAKIMGLAPEELREKLESLES